MAEKEKTGTTDKKNPFVEHVRTEFERYECYHSDRFEEDKEILEMWKNEPPPTSESWQNAVNVPLMVEGEQTITPRLFTALFPTDAPMDVQVEGDTPAEEGIRIKGIIQHYFRVCNTQAEALPALTQTTLFGTGYVEGGTWMIRKGWIYDKQTEKSLFGPIEARPDCRHIDYFEMFPHPAKRRMEDGLALIRRHYVDGEELKRMATANPKFETKNLEAALKSTPPMPGNSNTGNNNKGPEYNPKKEREYEILQYWGPWEETTYEDEKVTTKQAMPYWVIVVNREVCILATPNPYNHQIPPYCKLKLFEDPGSSWFGVGIGQIGKPTQERINKIVNQRLDNVDLVLNKSGVFDGNDTLLNRKKLQVSKPGKWTKVSDVDRSIKWMDTPDVTRSSYEEEKIAKQDFREATGATANLMPEVGSEHRTAMGIEMLQGAAGMRFRPVLRRLETDFIQSLAMFFFSNLKQFMPEPVWVQITGKNGELKPIRVTPQQIQSKVFFIPTGISETMNKEVQVGQLLRFKEVTVNDPTVNRQEINRRIAELFGFKDINKLLTPAQLPTGGPLTPGDQQNIQQRMGEGATPQQIKAEMMGPRPEAEVQ